MILKQVLRATADEFESIGLEDGRLEAEILLRHLLGLDRSAFHCNPELKLTRDQIQGLSILVKRRLNREPSAYITGHKEFFGLDFEVAPSVLIPRPETELLVEKAISVARSVESGRAILADIGTGCGAIAVALASQLPDAAIYASDISPLALRIARRNINRHGFGDRIVLLEGNLLDPLPERASIIVANLPYIRTSDLPRLGPEIAMFEPGAALDGGPDGLLFVRALLRQARSKLEPGGAILLEIGQSQGEEVRRTAGEAFPYAELGSYTDLSGIERVIAVQTRA
ncbi:MAG: peptide chain release factor N(5)-glutamine methyltransferase [Dehalococcoidia bacterium]|nr:peptide chain release factor N(5)-glutamine methyltransferase [Dehalococcoidia bacterium]